jgi:dTDP-4-dehydrorhamnose 3,5-epimerase
MTLSTFKIKDLLLIKPRIFEDDRGLFYESFNEEKYKGVLGDGVQFVQDNISISKKNVLRGLHFQIPPFAQGKLVTVLKGRVIDVAVDLRKDSVTFGQYQMVELSDENKYQFWIPPGFAHGFCTLEEGTIFSYKCNNYYSPEHEQTIMWKDLELDIDWKIKNPIISEKDKIGKDFNTFVSPF